MIELVTLALAGLLAGYVNAVAGGGSLLTLPALMFTGLDPVSANATNRIAVLFQNGVSLLTYRRGGHAVPWGTFGALAVPASAAAMAGAFVASRLSDFATRLILMVVMFAFLLLTLRGRPRDRPPGDRVPVTPSRLMILGFLGVGFYAGLLQAGVGILVLLLLSVGYRVDLLAANGVKVAIMIALAAVSIAIFWVEGIPLDLSRGALLAATTSLGSALGATAALRLGSGHVRWVMAIAVLGSMTKLAWDAFASS